MSNMSVAFGSERTKKFTALFAELATCAAGLIYGLSNLVINIDILTEFQSPFYSYLIVPLLFISGGIITAYITRMGITLVYWAMVKLLGGLGGVNAIFQITGASFIYFLPLVAVISGATSNLSTGIFYVVAGVATAGAGAGARHLSLGVGASQQFDMLKSVSAFALTVVFLASIFYLLMPA